MTTTKTKKTANGAKTSASHSAKTVAAPAIVIGPLAERIRDEARRAGVSLDALSISKGDQFRMDTAAGHRDGAWAGEQVEALVPTGAVHPRGMHYRLVASATIRKPDGTIYRNIDADWVWLQAALGYARWLGYVDFDRIADARNSAPIIVTPKGECRAVLGGGIDIAVPDAADIEPRIKLLNWHGVQPYTLVLVGEKTSLEPVLSPMVEAYGASLFLPSGDISDAMVYQIAKVIAAHDRPAICLYCSDHDPSGYAMPTILGRKLDALRHLGHFENDFAVRGIALTAKQATDLDLPSTPLKESDKRAGKWREIMGRDQTEIDALAALRPDDLTRIVRRAIREVYDTGLEAQSVAARDEYLARANAVMLAQLGPDKLEVIRGEMVAKLDDIGALVDEIEAATSIDPDMLELPVYVPPVAVSRPLPEHDLVYDSRRDWAEQSMALRERMAYQRDQC